MKKLAIAILAMICILLALNSTNLRYTAPIGDKVLIIYDQCDKSTIYDDEIVYIIHFTDFTK